jgi:hypothetical protein
MRRDPVVGSSNANGTNLWMLYSWPETITTSTEVVEIHLASSSDGGNSWTYNSTIWPSTYNSTTNQYSSHKVANFWPYTNGNWYAVHLEYFVTPGNTIAYSVPDGNLVTTVATSPANLATATSQNLYYSTLNTLVLDATGVTTACQGGYNIHGSPQGSWGEPAITVQSGTAYLITMCVSPNFTNSQLRLFKHGPHEPRSFELGVLRRAFRSSNVFVRERGQRHTVGNAVLFQRDFPYRIRRSPTRGQYPGRRYYACIY